MEIIFSFFLLEIFLTGVFIFIASAQVLDETFKEQPAGMAASLSEKRFEFEVFNRFTAKSSLKEEAGKVGVYKTGASMSYDLDLLGRLPGNIFMEIEQIGIDNSSSFKLPAHLNGLTSGFETTFPFYGIKNVFVNVEVDLALYGDGLDFKSGVFRTPFQAVFIYKLSPEWVLLAGAGGYPGYEDEVLPVFGFTYHPTDHLSFDICPPEPRIRYSINENWGLFLEGEESFDEEYRVVRNDSNRVILRRDEISVGAGARYIRSGFLEAAISVGRVFNRRLEYLDNQRRLDIKPGYYIDVKFSITM